MAKSDYDVLISTGKLPSSSRGETFISPTRSFAEDYGDIVVQFNVKPGTTQALSEIGVRDSSKLATQAYPDMPTVSSGWMNNNAFFKGEGQQVNIGLGKGKALTRFNESIESVEALPK
jgi:hypothetical protein